MAPPKPSTAASNTYAAPPQDLRNLTNYTLNYEEPLFLPLSQQE